MKSRKGWDVGETKFFDSKYFEWPILMLKMLVFFFIIKFITKSAF